MDKQPIKPITVLNQKINSRVIIGLRGNREYHGILDGYDVPHMNIVLKNAEEWEEGNVKRKLDTVILRGDNIIFISP